MIRLPALASAVVLAAALASCTQEDAASVPPPPLVQTFSIGPTTAIKQRFTGAVRARTEANLGFRVAGKIFERLVDPGARVHRGQPLMRLDPADFILAFNSAQATSEAARAQMVKTGADEERSRKLTTAGWTSAQAHDQTKAAAEAAAAQLEAAKAQAKQIANQVAYADLLADADGVVMEVPVEPGQVVAAGQPVVKLARDGAREAEVFLPEGSERWADSPAQASLYVDRDRAFPARLRELSAIADPMTRTYRARYVLGGAGESAPLGSTVTVELALDLRGREATRDVPLGAVFDNGEGTAVWRLDPGTSAVSAQPVTVVRLREERVEILSGLAEGDRIVALGAHLLKEGQRVRVAPAQVVGRNP